MGVFFYYGVRNVHFTRQSLWHRRASLAFLLVDKRFEISDLDLIRGMETIAKLEEVCVDLSELLTI